jgi:N-acetylmuramoyl-L-alanine amidase
MLFRMKLRACLWASLLVTLSACVSQPSLVDSVPALPKHERPSRPLGEIVVCGQRIPVNAPVVLWTEAPFYDATSSTYRFEPKAGRLLAEEGPRLVTGRVARADLPALAAGSEDVSLLSRHVTQFVIHYDACASSRRCFEILQDMRGLSVHFMLDVDGTIYQTCDVRETCWHASQANKASVGIEIANIGAYPIGAGADVLDAWYESDSEGVYMVYPPWFGETGVRTPNFTPRPRRAERVRGMAHGAEFEQHDFTSEQYRSLAALTRALCGALDIPLLVPRDAGGAVRTDALSDEELAAWSGLIGHQQITTRKSDPGPAFDWEHLFELTRRLDP